MLKFNRIRKRQNICPTRCCDGCGCRNVTCVKCRSCSELIGCRVRSKSWKVCRERCTKCLLVIVNFAFMVCGAVLVGLGMVLHVDRESLIYQDLIHRLPGAGPLVVVEKIPVIFIGIGVTVSILSFLGCYGAYAESVCCLSMYTIVLFLILLCEITFGSILTLHRDTISRRLESKMRLQIKFEYNKTALPGNMTNASVFQVTSIWDSMQVKLNCCGAVGPRDYRDSAWFNHTREAEGVFVPPSCCVPLREEHQQKKQTRLLDEDRCHIDAILDRRVSHALKVRGCRESAVKWLASNVITLVVVVSNIVLLQIIHLVFACSLLVHLRRSHLNYQWYEDADYG